MPKCLDGIIGCKDRTSTCWYLNGFPYYDIIVTLGHQYNVEEEPTVIPLTLIAMQGHRTKSKNKTETMLYIIKQGSIYGHTYSKSMDQPGKVANPGSAEQRKL